MSKVLFFFTSSYPFGIGETFIENEIVYLAKTFDKIVIFSNNTKDEQTRSLPNNVLAFKKNDQLTKWQKIIAYFSIFNIHVFSELIKTTNFRVSRINYLCQSFFKAKKTNLFITEKINEMNIDISELYLYSYWWLDEAIGIANFKRIHKEVKAFTRAHRYDLYKYASPINFLPLKKFTGKYLSGIFSISLDGMEYIKKNFNIQNVFVSRLGTQHQIESPKTTYDDKVLTIISCSNIYPNKNIHKIAEALLLIDNIKIKWHHFGRKMPGFSEEYFDNLFGNIEVLNQKNNIEAIYEGNISNSELMFFYNNNSVDLFINVSDSEGIPVSIMEAMSFGIPCIATGVGGTPEIVNDSNGRLIDQKSTPTEIAQYISDFYNLADEQKSLIRDNAYQTWKNSYNAERNYKDFIDKINNLPN